MTAIIAIAAAATAFFLGIAVFSRVLASSVGTERRMKALVQGDAPRKRERRRKAEQTARDPVVSRRLEKLDGELYAAGIKLKAKEFLGIWVLVAIVPASLLSLLGVSTGVCIGCALLGATGPIMYVRMTYSKQHKLLESQIVEALAVLSNSLRAGQSFQTAMESIAHEMPDPIAHEFSRVSGETRHGLPLDKSFERLVERTGSDDLELICNAVLIQRQIGGNLAEVLDNISGTIRERIALRDEVKTRTSSGMASGMVMAGLPIVVLAVLAVIEPDYISMFFNTTLGNILLLVCVALETIGFLLIKRIVTIKY